ncbi:MAG: hypothetical protein JOY78_01435 [Pseudonocardia sp.]|nr:hypothetical protein [Pseudonocardia sp.]
MGAARKHGIIDALNTAGISTIADSAYQGSGPAVRVPQRHRRLDPDTGRYRRLSHSQKQVNTAHICNAHADAVAVSPDVCRR